jgi:hypothetical protein
VGSTEPVVGHQGTQNRPGCPQLRCPLGSRASHLHDARTPRRLRESCRDPREHDWHGGALNRELGPIPSRPQDAACSRLGTLGTGRQGRSRAPFSRWRRIDLQSRRPRRSSSGPNVPVIAGNADA